MNKKSFIMQMRNRGVQVGTLYDPPLHQMKIIRDKLKKTISLPVAEKCASRSVSLPMFTSMSEDDISTVVHHIKEASEGL